MSEHVLLVAPTGIMEILHSDQPIDVKGWLERAAIGPCQYAELTLWPHDEVTASVIFLPGPDQPPNLRAREILVLLTGTHALFSGSVAFVGLAPQHLTRVLAEVG